MPTIHPVFATARAVGKVFPVARVIGLLTVMASLLQVSFVDALTYLPRMDRALWISKSHVLSCQLIQPIPSFGRAIFNHSAGKELTFYLETVSSPFAAGHADLTSRAAVWNPTAETTRIGRVHVQAGQFPVQLNRKLATELLAELYKGQSPAFVRKAWYAEEEAIEVGLSPATFREAYSDYRQCLGKLSPIGFDQLERSRIVFKTDEWELTPQAIDWLDTMVNYLLAANDVEQLFIDGHTDDTHTTTYNIELSRKRAEAVMHYLTSKGVSSNQLTTRFHGERFPVANNKHPAGRAENRRVTLRVELATPPLAQR